MKLSIITINYNNLDGLRNTINSVLSQTFHNYEWIIIDGGSSDGSKDVIEDLQQLLAFWCSEPDKGVYDAMNKGIRHANGDYIIFMNSGDVFVSEITLYQVFSQAHSSDVLYGDWMHVFDTYKKHLSFPLDYLIAELVDRNICHQSMFFKLSLLKNKGYDLSYKIYADYARNVELALSGAVFEHLPFVICEVDAYGISSDEATLLVRNEEKERIKHLYPQWIVPLLHELNGYKNRRSIQYTERIIKSHCVFLNLITKAYLQVVYSILNLFNCK